MSLHLFPQRTSRQSRLESRRRRPILEDLESRTVLSTAAPAPAIAPAAQVTPHANLASQVHVAVPLNITGINLTSITRNATTGALTAVGTLTGNLLGHAFTTPLQVSLTPPATANGVPVLHLQLNPIHLNLLGLKVDTSPICLNITAHPGPGNLLGNLLGGLSGILDTAGTATSLTGVLGQLNTTLNNGSLLGGLNTVLGQATSQAGSPTVTGGPTTNILNLSLGPVDLNLLGLEVALDNCANGPVTVSISAVRGPGNLLGNLLSSVAHLLDNPVNPTAALTQQIGRILGIVRNA